MTTEAVLSGGISIVILVLASLKRAGVLDKGWELLKEWLKRKREEQPKDVNLEKAKVENKQDWKPQIDVVSPPVSQLQMYLDCLDRERVRLDAEYETVQNFLKKKEKTPS